MSNEKVYLKLNDNYSNAFLTTNHGEVFYKDWLKQNRPEYVEIDKETYERSFELKEFVRMKMLILKEKHKHPDVVSAAISTTETTSHAPGAAAAMPEDKDSQTKAEETPEDVDNSLFESSIIQKN